MNTVKAVAFIIFLLAFGSILLKQGVHIYSAKEKMLKANARPTSRRYPKWYFSMIGAAAIIAALYFAYRLILN